MIICGLFNDAVNSSDNMVPNDMKIHEEWIGKHMEGNSQDLIWGISLEGLRKITKNLGQNSQCMGCALNMGPPDYEAGVLTTQKWHLVQYLEIDILSNAPTQSTNH
jgi:hypothetical protein